MTGQLTLGVIGHVDHGKTALVKALTGIETDRLAEERARGLSIVLGFAHLEASGGSVDLIDVPGHEDFIRAMISGVTGIDGILLVVAANEGVMPQTREHVAIANLLGIERGLVALTKSDLVDEAEVAARGAEIRTLLDCTAFNAAPLIPVSSRTGAGIPELKTAIEAMLGAPPPRATGGDFYLPLDRVFSVRGFGVVATGTLRGGVLRVNDRVEVLPSGRMATVRGLERHGSAVAAAHPGERVAVNLRGIEQSELARGETLAAPGMLTPTERLDAEIVLLDEAPKPLANGARVRVLVGTSEVLARVRLLDRDALDPGATALAQLRCERKLATQRGERLLLRSYSPMRTIGGGLVLEVEAPRHRRFDARVTAQLATRATGDAMSILDGLLAVAGANGIEIGRAAAEIGLDVRELAALIFATGGSPPTGAAGTERGAGAPGSAEAAPGAGGAQSAGTTRGAGLDDIVACGRVLVAAVHFAALTTAIVAEIEAHHVAQPRARGMPLGTVRAKAATDVGDEVWSAALAALITDGHIDQGNGLVWRKGFDAFAGLSTRERDVLDKLELQLRQAGLEPRSVESLLGTGRKAQELANLLVAGGRLVRLVTSDRNARIVLHTATLDSAKEAIRLRFPPPQRFTVADIRDVLKSTRRHVVPLLEHLDATGFTIRIGDQRHVRGPS